MKRPRVVKGMPSVELSRKEFILRFHRRHEDPTFDAVAKPLDAVAEVAWKNYIEYHKSPNTRKAGSAASPAPHAFCSSTARPAATRPAPVKCPSPTACARSRGG